MSRPRSSHCSLACVITFRQLGSRVPNMWRTAIFLRENVSCLIMSYNRSSRNSQLKRFYTSMSVYRWSPAISFKSSCLKLFVAPGGAASVMPFDSSDVRSRQSGLKITNFKNVNKSVDGVRKQWSYKHLQRIASLQWLEGTLTKILDWSVSSWIGWWYSRPRQGYFFSCFLYSIQKCSSGTTFINTPCSQNMQQKFYWIQLYMNLTFYLDCLQNKVRCTRLFVLRHAHCIQICVFNFPIILLLSFGM